MSSIQRLIVLAGGLLLLAPNAAEAKTRCGYRVSKLDSRRSSGADALFSAAYLKSRQVSYRAHPELSITPSLQPRVKTKVLGDGSVHEHGRVLVKTGIRSFFTRVNPVKWASVLPGLFAEDAHVVKDQRRPDGTRVVHLRQRMLIGKNPLTRLDMDKDTVVTMRRDGSVSVDWSVTNSQASRATLWVKTVLRDDGHVEFRPTRRNGREMTEIYSDSIHKVTTAPSKVLSKLGRGGQKLTRRMTERSLKRFWVNTLDTYAALGAGR